MAVYGFDQASAQRIGDAIRRVEGRRVGSREVLPSEVGRNAVGVRCMVGQISTAAWSKENSGTVTLYSGQPGSESSVETLSAYNYFADIPTSTNTARWVAVSNNGFGWILLAAECD